MREHLDQTDRRLVKLLSQDAQPGINRLAETMAISVPTVRSRLRNLLDRNLLKIVGLLNLTERPELISAIVGINAQGRGRARELAQRISELPFVNSASVVTGRFDIIVDVTVAGDVADLYRITSELIPGAGDSRRSRAQRDLRRHGLVQQMGQPSRRLLVGRRTGAQGAGMKIAVLGGLGLQGRAAIADLVASAGVEEIVCVDTSRDGAARLAGLTDLGRVRFVVPEGAIGPALANVHGRCRCRHRSPAAAADARGGARGDRDAHAAGHDQLQQSIADLAPAAEQAGVSIMTECGLDPGIDLVLYARAAQQFDSIATIDSYCGGIPEPKAMAKPLCYKVSWNFDMVLMSQNRDSVLIEEGERVEVPAGQQHDNPFIHEIEVDGLGRLEAFPNGDAPHYAAMLGAAEGLQRTGRYSLRWPGWSAFWAPLKELGFLSEEPVAG